MFHRGFPRNRRFYGGNNFMRNHQMVMPMPMSLPQPTPVGPPIDPEFLRHTEAVPSITWCENAQYRVHGAQPAEVPAMAISKKLSKRRRKSKEERMAKEVRKLKKQERKLKLESIFIKSPTPERVVAKPSTSQVKSEQLDEVTLENDSEKKSDIDKKSGNKSVDSSDAKNEKKSDDGTERRTKKTRKNSEESKDGKTEKKSEDHSEKLKKKNRTNSESGSLNAKTEKKTDDRTDKQTNNTRKHTENSSDAKPEKKSDDQTEKALKENRKNSEQSLAAKTEKVSYDHTEKRTKKNRENSEESLDTKTKKTSDTRTELQIKKSRKASMDVILPVKIEEIKLEKSPPPQKIRNRSPEKSSEKKVPKKEDKPPEIHRSQKKSEKTDLKQPENKRENQPDKEKKPEIKGEKHTDKKLNKKEEKVVEKERQPGKKPDTLCEKLEKKVEKSTGKILAKSSEKKIEKNTEKKRDSSFETSSEKRRVKSSESRSEKSLDIKSDKVSEKSGKRSKSISRPKFESPKERDSRSITPVIFDSSEVPASPKIEIDQSSEIYKQDEIDEPQTPPIIEVLSKLDGSDKKLSIFDRSPVEGSPKLDESLLGAEMLKLNLENKLRELDAEEDEEIEEEPKLEVDIFSEDSPKATEAMKTIWSIQPDRFNIPIRRTIASLYDDDMLSPTLEPATAEVKDKIDEVIIPIKSEESTVHVINSLENLQVCYGEEDDDDVEMPLTTVALLKLAPGEWDDEFSNSSYTKLCDEIQKHKSMIQEKGQKESQKDIQKADGVQESQENLEKEVKKEPAYEQVEESEALVIDVKKEPEQNTEAKESILNNEYEAFIKLLDESDTSEKKPLVDRRSRSQSNSSNSSSRSSSSSSSSSGSSSSSSSSSSNSSDSSSSSSSSSGSSSSSASESTPQFEENDVLKRALEKIMEIIPENYDGGDRSGFNPEDLKNEILKILQSDANLNKKMQNVEIEPDARKSEPLKIIHPMLEPGQSKIWNISTDSDEILTASPIKKLQKPKSPDCTSKSFSSSDRKSRKQTSDYRSEKRSSSREKYRKQRSRDRSRDYYNDRRNSARNRSKSPRRRKSRSPVIKERSRKSPPPDSRISPKSNKWTDNVSYLEDSSYISNYGFRPPSPKEPSQPESDFQYPEISSSSWNSEPSNQYCAYPPAHADTSPQRISLDERIDMALGISTNNAQHSTYYNYSSERYPVHNEAYNTPAYNQYYHQYKAAPPAMPTYPIPPPPLHHNYYPPTYPVHPSLISVVHHQGSPFLHRNISTPPIHHQPSPQPSQKASFAVQVGNVLEIIPSELPSQSIAIPKPSVEKSINISQSSTPQQPTSSDSKTAEQIISEAVDQRKQQRDQKRFSKKLRKEKLKLEISKLINLSNSMKIADSIAASVEAESDSNDVSTTVESTSDAIPLGKPERGILRQGEKTGVVARKKVMFHDGIEPGNGTSTTDDEKIPPEKMKKKKKRRYSSNKENIALINQLLGTTRETSMNPEKPPEPAQPTEPEEYEDKLPPPPPPSGSPPPNCLQPKLKNPPAPEYLYFHLNPNENRLILTPYRPQIFHMQSCFAQLQQLMAQPNQRRPTTSTQSQPSLPFNIPSRLDGLLNDPRFANAINALSNSLRLPIVQEPKNDTKPATPSTPVGANRDEAAKKSGTWTSV